MKDLLEANQRCRNGRRIEYELRTESWASNWPWLFAFEGSLGRISDVVCYNSDFDRERTLVLDAVAFAIDFGCLVTRHGVEIMESRPHPATKI